MPLRSATITMASTPLDTVPTHGTSRSRSNKKLSNNSRSKAKGSRQAHQSEAAATTTTTGTTVKRAQKRKMDVSDEDMNDFMPQSRQQLYNGDHHQAWSNSNSSSTIAQHTLLPASESMQSLTSYHESTQRRPVKRFMEEDRGFVFARKKVAAPQQPSSALEQPRMATNKHLKDVNDSGSGTHPPTPERSPSEEALVDPRRAGTQKSKRQHQEYQPEQQQNGSSAPLVKTRGSKSSAAARHSSKAGAQPSSSSLSRSRGPATKDYTPSTISESVIAIPMRETPMIKKNKDMRGDSRRSSFTLRGKRASSIGSGFEAQPHPAIDPKGFYRHISADLPDPVRMKQLLAWCGRKSADILVTESTAKGSASSSSALRIAKAVQEDVLNMAINNKITLSWYNRPQDPKESSSSLSNNSKAIAKKPHKQNVENRRKLREYEEQMVKLKHEDEQWTKLISSYNTFHASILDSGPKLPPGAPVEPIVFPSQAANDIEVDILTADERRLWEKHCQARDYTPVPPSRGSPRSPATLRPNRIMLSTELDTRWIPEKMKNLESQVDDLRDKLYKASQFNKVARQYTDQLLEQIAVVMERRQRPPVDPLTPYPLAFTSFPSSSNNALTLQQQQHLTNTSNGHVSLPFPPPPPSASVSANASSSVKPVSPPLSLSGGSSSRGCSTGQPAALDTLDTRDIMRQLSRLCI